MSGRPPGSTLFPDTALFRSDSAGAGERGAVLRPLAELLTEDVVSARPPQVGAVLRRGEAGVGDPDHAVDRKSTRLNSSHANISYAVFCLKKKIHLSFTPCPR